MTIPIHKVIEWKYGKVANTCDGRITAWNHPTIPQPSDDQLRLDTAEYEAFLKRNVYKELRVPEYPALSDLADAIVKKENGDPKPLADYVATCLAVKAKYPKPGVNS
jgi:hypothetical protein